MDYQPKTGVLIISHGSSKREWKDQLTDMTAAINLPVPAVLSFLEFDDVHTVQHGINELEDIGIQQIIAVPLFISSGSTHIEEIRTMLGLTTRFPLDFETDTVTTSARIIWCEPMNDHPVILSLLERRIQAISRQPNQEALIITAHGSDQTPFSSIWADLMQRIAAFAEKRFAFRSVTTATLLPDQLTSSVKEVDGQPLILPLFLCHGYFTRSVIPKRLNDPEAARMAEPYLPDNAVAEWIIAVVMENLNIETTQSIKKE